ncbi:MAG: esterase-like activity of phytase family protein, partial [Nitratireductor sp.]|nr:esterase-like activity of phytase family protein [Nitratireductor sp.]
LIGSAAIAVIASPLGFASSGPGKVTAEKISFFELGETGNRFGKLEFVGGLQLASDMSGFGGFSALRLYPDRNRLIAVSDRCRVLTATLERDAGGVLRGIEGATLRPLPADASGRPISKTRYSDCEALDVRDGKAFIAFERNSQTARFKIRADGSLAEFAPVRPKPGIGQLDRNRGIEAMALFPAQSRFDGSILSISELTLNAEGNHRAFINGEGGVTEFAVARRDDYSVTDADFLPDGDLLILERRFGLSIAPGMRIRRIPASSIAEGATVDGEVLIEAGLAYRIDNMEGLAVNTGEDGQVYLTLISDDNFMVFQSTLLLEFRLVGEVVSGPREPAAAPRP